MRRVNVAVPPPYDVTIGAGAGALAELSRVVGDRANVVVSQAAVFGAHGAALKAALGGSEPWVELVADGEDAKSFATVEGLCRTFADGGLPRGGVVVAFGGGVVGDTAGFAAAVYHRGVAVVQVPTTLLAQVDAAVGGKTAVNLPEGKNLVGAFHQPLGVVVDTSTLSTLPDAEYRSGLGEVAKYSLMPQGAAVAAVLDADLARVLARDPATLEGLVAECVEIKAAVVGADPEERTGARATLNFGHTFGHALETVAGYTHSHGEAVAVGLVFATHLARSLDRVDDAAVARTEDVLTSLGLPISVGQPEEIGLSGVGASELLDVMHRDKKASGGLTFVLPGPAGLESVDDPPASALEAAMRAVGVPASGGGG
jgi:5-deoxy-5-amino-3-dehydroquinate synthase